MESPCGLFDSQQLELLAKSLRLDRHRLQRFRNALLKHQHSFERAVLEIPTEVRHPFTQAVAPHPLKLAQRHDSQIDGASKLVFQHAAGGLLETVILRINTGRTALCISSQIGCAAKCTFCATGQMKIAHNLTAAEILDQVVQANQLLQPENRRVRNIVFMGMGEPFHNTDQVYAAIDELCSPRGFNLSPKHVAVSTVGLPQAMVAFAQQYPHVSLALSLHSARQEVRESIIPLARKFPLSELQAALREVTRIQSRPVMIEYLLLAGVNDRPEDLAALIDYLRDLPIVINLIPYNATSVAPDLEATPLEARWDFARGLRAEGYSVTMRYSLGSDIEAACGQLVRDAEWKRKQRVVEIDP